MKLFLSDQAIKCLINGQTHPDFNPYSIGSLIKRLRPEIPDCDLVCICQVKRILYEGVDSIINLLINMQPHLLEDLADAPPPKMMEIMLQIEKAA